MELVNLTGFEWGIESDEIGINISSLEATQRPEFKEFLQDRKGEKRGFALGATEQEISVEGEISGATGLMTATFALEVGLVNDVDYFGVTAGTIFMDEATVRRQRDGFKTLSMKCSRNQGIVLVP